MIRDLMEELTEDSWRQEHPFSDALRACQDVLYRPGASRIEMEQALNDWLGTTEQPCLFGRMEARQGRLAYCLLTENDLQKGDDHVRARIQEERNAWKIRALDGRSHGFIIVAISPQIATAAVDARLLRLSRHLCGLYLNEDEPDQMFYDRLHLTIQTGDAREFRRWKVGVNFFSAQGDGRWWQDHRFPGGIAYSMNSVGHMARHKVEERLRQDSNLAARIGTIPRDRLVGWALPNAIRSIGPTGIRNPQGTWLVDRGHFGEDMDPPTEEVRRAVVGPLTPYSENRYHGKYHTDETIPSPYFDHTITTLEQAKLRDDLYFTYLHSLADPDYPAMGVGLMAQAIEEEEETRQTERRNT